MNCIIGVDIGTTSTKAIVFNRSGQILSQHAIKYGVYSPSAGYNEQSPHEIFDAVVNTIKHAWAQVSDTCELDGVCFSSAMHGIMPVDIEGTPLTQCIIWADTRSKEIAKKIKEGPLGVNLYQRTGTPIHPMSPLCKIIWIRENMPEVFAKAHKYISFKEYVFFKLFGKYIIDFSIASCTGLFDIYDKGWNQEALKLAGIRSENLSAPVPVHHMESKMAPEYATYMGLPDGIPFIIGASDGCLANLGSNAISKGRAAVTIGTSGAIRMAFKEPVEDPKCRIFNYILSNNYIIAGGPINNGGIILQWFLENVSPSGSDGHTGSYTEDIRKASLLPPGANKLIFLPYLLGERAPHWDAEARGVFFGLNITHNRLHMIKAILEGVIFSLLSVAEALENTSDKIEIIYANGGFAKSKEWVQILADIFGKRVLVSESVEGSAWGAAIVGLEALGLINSMEDDTLFQEKLTEIVPNSQNHEKYQLYFKTFSRLYEKLKDEFSFLDELDMQ